MYFDQDSLDARVIDALHARDVDVLTATESGMQRSTDEEHLTFAAAQKRALYSANLSDFARLHHLWMASGRSHCGVIVRLRQEMDPGAQIRALEALIADRDGKARDWFEYLHHWLPSEAQ